MHTPLLPLLLIAVAAPARADDPLVLRLSQYGDSIANVSGGTDRGIAQIGQFDANLSLDADRLWGWRKTKFYIRGFANNGASIGDLAGDALGIDSWETGRREARLLEAWVDREFADGHIGVRAGLYDTTTDFDSSRTDALFLNNAAGMNTPMLAQPDVQYVFNPIYAPEARHALVLGLRFVSSYDSSRRS